MAIWPFPTLIVNALIMNILHYRWSISPFDDWSLALSSDEACGEAESMDRNTDVM